MRLIVNIEPLLSPLTGIGHYTNQLLIKLLESGEIKDIRGLSPFRWYDQVEVAKLLQASGDDEGLNVSAKRKKARMRYLINLSKKVPYSRAAKTYLQQKTVRKQAANYRDYLYWEPSYTLLPLSNPAVTTIHDLSHIHYPEFHPRARVKLLNKNLEQSIARAQRLIAVSEYTKMDISQQFGVPLEQIDIVSPAVNDSFRRQHSEDELDQIRSIYQLPRNYILSVATLEPRKNITGLIKAFISLPAEMRKEYPLVLVGVKGWLTGDLEKTISSLVAKDELVLLGYVEQQHLPKIYAAATVMAYVSFFEGFGMPVAEAMAAGTPVITSNTSSMPGVANGAAMLVEPEHTESIREALFELLSDERCQKQMSDEGREVARGYTWGHSADRLRNVLSKLS